MRRAVTVSAPIVGGYLHDNANYAAIVALETSPPLAASALGDIATIGNRIAQHVVAMDPEGSARANSSRAEVVEALLKQNFVLDASRTVADVLAAAGKAAACSVRVMDFVRWDRKSA